MKEKVNLEWDGETVKQSISVPDKKFTPKEILDSLDHVKGQIDQMIGQQAQLKQQEVMLENQLQSAEAFLKERKPFEEECLRIQLDKLKLYIHQSKDEYIKQAKEEAEKTIAEDPSAYTEDQKINMPYVNYQRLLATNDKIGQKISKRLISEHLFQKPIFNNPFKKD